MFEIFERYIRQTNDLPEADLAMVREKCTEKKLRKGQSLLHEGEIWSMNCFITSGCFRLYRTDKDGVEHTARFGIENWWMTDIESYIHQKPSEYNIEALSSSTAIVWTKTAWEEILHHSTAMKLFNDQLLERAYIASQRRIFSLISSNAAEKYFEFQKTYPNVFNKVPLHMVASYLGISRETLSRIRREYAKI
jgi:CRP/FNR family transcriptional regulator, anaerobic regulatory protein